MVIILISLSFHWDSFGKTSLLFRRCTIPVGGAQHVALGSATFLARLTGVSPVQKSCITLFNPIGLCNLGSTVETMKMGELKLQNPG